MPKAGTQVRLDGVQWLTDAIGRLLGYVDDRGNEVLGTLESRFQVTGPITFTGSVVPNGSKLPIAATATTLPLGWLQPGDGLNFQLQFEWGGTNASQRSLGFALQPVADAGSTNNLLVIGYVGNSDTIAKDASYSWITTLTSAGLKTSADFGLGLSDQAKPAMPIDTTKQWNLFCFVGALENAANSITIHRFTASRVR